MAARDHPLGGRDRGRGPGAARRPPAAARAAPAPAARRRAAPSSAPAPASRPRSTRSGARSTTRVSGVKLNYQSIGSGGGISAIEAKTVDFGASDAPLEEADLDAERPRPVPDDRRRRGPRREPRGRHRRPAEAHRRRRSPASTWARSRRGTTRRSRASTPASSCRRPRSTSCIARTARAPPGSSPTTSPAAAGNVWTAGADKEIPWPVGVGGKGNEGVAASVQQLSGSIGYVEYAYAKQAEMTTMQLQNKDGAWVQAEPRQLRRRRRQRRLEGQPAEHVPGPGQPARQDHVADHRRLVHPRPEGPGGRRPRQGHARLLRLGLHERRGRGHSSLDYVPIPANVYDLVETQVWTDVTASGTPVWP